MTTADLHALLINLISSVAPNYNLISDGEESIFNHVAPKKADEEYLQERILRVIKEETPGVTHFRILAGNNPSLIPFLCKVVIPEDKRPEERFLDGDALIFSYTNSLTAGGASAKGTELSLAQIKRALKKQAKAQSIPIKKVVPDPDPEAEAE